LWCAALLPTSAAFGAQEGGIDFGSLLDEMLDRGTLARFPSPSYTCRQFSSYDRNSVSPEDQDTWFANGDRGQYLRVEENAGRTEWVMMDADGPGAVVRIWSANPQGTLRVYLDGAHTPALEGPMTELLGGTGIIASPLSAQRSKGWNLYLPIPYAKHCKLTSDAGDFYYQVNYRTYEPRAVVKSFSREALEAQREKLARVQQELLSPAVSAGEPAQWLEPFLLKPDSEHLILRQVGPGLVESLGVRIRGQDPEQSLRTVVLRMTFDDEQTVWCPLGDFFGTGAGLTPFEDWWRTVRSDGTLICRWPMPYRESYAIEFLNLGPTTPEIRLGWTENAEWRWDERCMHFHATWRQENPIHTRPMHDWNYVDIEGRGVFVGDNLHIANPVKTWWGEGDEKIWVDGEDFPSHFGTGTEDYYGYAWCSPELFLAPFHSQPRCDGPQNFGHTLISRVRALDAIPFTRSFKFDMEVWHWKEVDVGYAATTYFYAYPGATTNRGPSPEEAARGLVDPPPLPPPFKIEGALECEQMEVVAQTEGISVGAQGGFGPKLWSGEQQLWIQGQKVGDFVELRVPAEGSGPWKVEVFATKSWDYGIVLFSIDGEPTEVTPDLYHPEVIATGSLDLGLHEAQEGALILRCEVIDGNPESRGSRSFFGLDCVRLTPVD